MALFEGLSERLSETVNRLRGKGRVTEKDIKDMMREIRIALLEADVNFKVVKDFIAKVSERALGQDVLDSLTPGQQVIKVVHEGLIELMGGESSKILFSPRPPTVILIVGLNGAGKTTMSAKLAGLLRKQGKTPLLVACDVYRPAAVKQLQVVGAQIDVPVFSVEGSQEPVAIASAALRHAAEHQQDLVIIDTAGRLHVNEELMDELVNIKTAVKPHEILLVVDAMTGQDAVNVAETFNEKLGIDGIVLTKLDGDTRGGAALSVRAVTGKPIKLVGVGEKLGEIEQFHPDRMASRILGMGDVLSLIEKAQESFDEKKAIELEKKMRSQQFTFTDYLDQMQQIKKMGPISQVIGMIPGLNTKALQGFDEGEGEKKLARIEAMINSMTKKERDDPGIINGSRKKRIASGSGTSVQEVNRLLRDFENIKRMFKMMTDSGGKFGSKKMKNMKLPF
ncbi:MAG: signal recognition particle protein [Clostridiales bacterium]|jgi:signal recognition particle subunit SRP54|nr:signal recognition particle protein [Clostridiales bacterium]